MHHAQADACPAQPRRTLLELLENVIAAQFEAESIALPAQRIQTPASGRGE